MAIHGDPRAKASAVAWKHTGLVLVILIASAGVNLAIALVLDAYELQQLARRREIAPEVLRRFEFRTIVCSTSSASHGLSFSYRLRLSHRGNGDRKMPLIVYLHGSGDRGSDNVQQLGGFASALCQKEIADAFLCTILAPQCPEGFNWASAINTNTDVLDGVLKMIDDVLQDDRIDPDRVYLMGYSMGGFGAWELAARDPGRFAAQQPDAAQVPGCARVVRRIQPAVVAVEARAGRTRKLRYSVPANIIDMDGDAVVVGRCSAVIGVGSVGTMDVVGLVDRERPRPAAEPAGRVVLELRQLVTSVASTSWTSSAASVPVRS